MQIINNRLKQQQSKKSILKSQSLQKQPKQPLITTKGNNNKTKKQHTNNQQSPKPFKLLTQLKHIFQKQLPSLLSTQNSNNNNNIQTSQQSHQGKYLLKLSQILQLLTTKTKQNNNNMYIITPQMLFTIINVQNQLNQLLLLFNNLIQNKQIVVAIIHQIYHRLMNHIISTIATVKLNRQQQKYTNVDNNMVQKIQELMNFLNKQLFDSIEFLLLFQCGMQQQTMFYQKGNTNVVSNETQSQSFNKNVIDIDKDREQMIKRLKPMFQTTYRYYKWVYQSIYKYQLMMRQKHQQQQQQHQQMIKNTLSQSHKLQSITLLHVIKQFSHMIIKYVEVIKKLLS